MANTYTLIDKAILTTTQTSVTFSSIPATYTDLLLKLSVRDSRNDGVNVSNINFNFNGTGAGTNYSGFYLYGTGSSVTNSTAGISAGAAAFSAGSDNTANTFGNAEIYIPNYASSNYKSISSDSVSENNGSQAFALLLAGLWSNTAAINSIAMTPYASPFLSGSSFYLYGISNS